MHNVSIIKHEIEYLETMADRMLKKARTDCDNADNYYKLFTQYNIALATLKWVVDEQPAHFFNGKHPPQKTSEKAESSGDGGIKFEQIDENSKSLYKIT